MLPSLSLSTRGSNFTTTSSTTPTSTSPATAMLTTVSSPTMSTSSLPRPSIQTLIHHDFFGDPVELETAEDSHLLGFNIDLTNRTITYIQPTQPWKNRDPTSAGSQRLTLLDSRPAFAPFTSTLFHQLLRMLRRTTLSPYPKRTCSNRLPTVFEEQKKTTLSHESAPMIGVLCVSPSVFRRLFFSPNLQGASGRRANAG